MAPHPPANPNVAHNLALALIASSCAPLLLLDGKLDIVAASSSFGRAFQLDLADVEGRPLAKLGAGEWNVPQLLSLLRATASGFAQVQDYELDLVRAGHGTRRLLLNVTKLAYDDEDDVRLILAASDVTDARLAEQLKEKLLRDKDVLLQEIHHRVANSLQIIAGVLMQSARKVQSEETRGHLFDAHHRVMSVASLQQQLTSSQMGEVEMRPYLTALCDSIGASMIHDGDQLSLNVTADESVATADTSVSVGLIVTELVINALKHAFPDNRRGVISVYYHAQNLDWTLSVSDDGIGMPAESSQAKVGLGTGIVQALATQLGAVTKVAPLNPGTNVSIVHVHTPVLASQAIARDAPQEAHGKPL